MDRKDWTRIGVAATLLLVPGGFLLGAALVARRYRRDTAPEDLDPAAATAPAATPDTA